jgi:hypothetical protein
MRLLSLMFAGTIKLEHTTSLKPVSQSYPTVYRLQNVCNVEHRIITTFCEIMGGMKLMIKSKLYLRYIGKK